MSGLSLRNIYKKYAGDVIAVSDFSMEIQDKEFIVLVGPSGCGKSTTLRMIAGLEDISSGDLFIDGGRANDVAPKDRDIAMVFQNYALYPHMTVYDNIAFGLQLRKMSKEEIDKRVREAASILEIEPYLKRKPKALSGGQRQRVALGRAMVRNPKVFLMDEPLSNLDAKLRVSMRTEIAKLHQRLATTFIYVTHDQTEAMTMGTRIVVMKDGFMQQIDTPENLYAYPENEFVAKFIGSPQMNTIPCTMKKNDKGGFDFIFEGHRLTMPEAVQKRLIQTATVRDGSEFDGKQVLLGIRPEDVYYEEAYVDLMKDAVVSCKTQVVEMLGSDTYVYFCIENNGKEVSEQMIARIAPTSKIKPGDIINLSFDLRMMHLFDRESGKTMLSRRETEKQN